MYALGLFGLAALAAAVPLEERAQKPKSFLQMTGNQTWILGNEIWNVTQGAQYGTKLWYKGKDRVGVAAGHYVSYNGAASDISWSSASIVESGTDWINVKFTANEGDFHWVIYDNLAGAYQYFVNRDLPTLGEFRTLWRLDNTSFPRGHTNVKDGVLPSLDEYNNATNVQDETWQKADGSYLTKYDWSANVRENDFHGVYGNEVGSWYLNPGKDYFNGDQTKQELMVHRESKTGDAVQLNMVHGTHYQAISRDEFAPGKTWGPWLWYLNDGSVSDATTRAQKEDAAWPYKWFKDTAYQSRGKIQGRLVLSDGRPAAGAAVFLGDNNNATISTLDQGQGYYYTTYADANGRFAIDAVRTGTYGLYAWGNGGAIADVTTNFTQNDIVVRNAKGTNLKDAVWKVTSQKKRIFQVGAFDRKTDGFALSGPTPFEHGRIAKCPASLTYTVGSSSDEDWCFGQSALGTWSVVFPVALPANSSSNGTAAKLTVSLAGFSQGSSADFLLNGAKVGNVTSASLTNSQDTYRGATRSGEWRLLEFPVSAAGLKDGVNTLDVTVTRSTLWRGWLWDSLVLEWV
ncbi:polysaccharide lyase family 4 protein [Dothidotthia symphoricarpi CBS 119687]|uniref:rhamnogalacturonan endolyase n=1 Tax=Dothidotthia symphoricarpi CBS 119687 TaxID=1392245 RepID=A0A6A6AUQ8_9PLEO|nr:polysaccharide lyase family 4 protein [Dothidotthia symphoricarpi CBS 119687]KAF2134928.1 polysaccharide lyase family 4 protein [Dothidotthia symphoricarpi CBS 119687]